MLIDDKNFKKFESYDPESMNDYWRDEVIHFNVMNFQNFFTSLVTILEAITLEDWSKQLFNLQNAGYIYQGTIFYLIIVFFGSYFILNLILAVIMSSYIKFQAQYEELEELLNLPQALQE